jgi:hypothetical protein
LRALVIEAPAIERLLRHLGCVALMGNVTDETGPQGDGYNFNEFNENPTEGNTLTLSPM